MCGSRCVTSNRITPLPLRGPVSPQEPGSAEELNSTWEGPSLSLGLSKDLQEARHLMEGLGEFHNLLVAKQTAGFQVALVVENTAANAGDVRDSGSIPGSGRSPGGGCGNPLQGSCLENSNPMDRGAWWNTVCGVAKSQT